MTVAVVSPKTTTPLDDELSATVADTLVEVGEEPLRLVDGEVGCLDAEVVLLVGDCLEFDRTADLLRETARRPRTVLWQLHPLPPPDMPVEVAARGQRVSNRLHDLQMRGCLGRTLVRLRDRIPPALRVRIRGLLYRRVRRSPSSGTAQRAWPVDEASFQFALMRYAWIARRTSERWLDLAAMSAEPRAVFLRRQGIAASFVPIGYHPVFGRDLALERDIDVLFLGRASMRRREGLLERIELALRRSGRRLHRVEAGCYGEARTRLLNRARIYLNLSNYPWEAQALRFVMGMACGALVVSEPLDNTAPFRPAEHFVASAVDELPEAIGRWLEDDVGRRNLTRAAGAFVTRDVTMRASVAEMLARVRGEQWDDRSW